MRLAVLASGSGTLLDAMASDGLPIELVMVDRHCPVEDVAARHAIPCVVVERTDFGDGFDRDAFTDRVVATLADHGIDLVAMAGWGTILGRAAFEALPGRIVNTHPALLPAFPGWHAVRDALAMTTVPAFEFAAPWDTSRGAGRWEAPTQAQIVAVTP